MGPCSEDFTHYSPTERTSVFFKNSSDKTMQDFHNGPIPQKLYHEVNDTIQIAINVISRQDPPALKNDHNRFVETMCYYTGVNKEYINQTLKKMKAKKTFTEWLRFKSNSNEAPFLELVRKIEYEDMRKVIIDQYVNNLQIPTKATIIQAIKETMNSDQVYTPAMLNQDLNNLGFIWKRLPKSDKYIVVENTEQFSKRMKYLHQMKEYRENKRVLIHVERTIPCSYKMSKQRVHRSEIIVAASPQIGIIDIYFPPKLQTLEFWLKNKLHTLPSNSVFVIEQSNPFAVDWEPVCTLPTIHSQKTEMIEWLDTYDIPHDPKLHRGELFALIQKNKVNYPPLYRFCEILKASGHEVIFRPPELTYFKFFKRLMRPIFSKSGMTLQAFKGFVNKKINSVNPEYWVREDQLMAVHEQMIYDEDQKLELILERLMNNVKNGNLSASDFKEFDSDEFDREFLDNVVFDAAPVKKPKRSKLSFEPEPLESVKPGPSGSVMSKPSASFEPRPSDSVKPGPSESVMPGPSASFKPGPSSSVKPGPSGSIMPGPSTFFEPGPSEVEVLPSTSFKPSKPGPDQPSSSQDPSRSSLLYRLLSE
ncbi:hypothetical protein PYW08_010710 [Mythimna loreyi]|uniref:Uncharacterized protein n=1 Tax=Mythimna loreyi TaxID=667449 RepID=A0ACC2Q8V5_9NEOP|nr:hypothetical protein PYW08_010710 [Mythimna loreyi]